MKIPVSIRWLILSLTILSQSAAADLVADLGHSTNHYDWASLSGEIDKQEIIVDVTQPDAFVRYQLVRWTKANVVARDEIFVQIAALGPKATPALISGIRNAAYPAPIFTDSTVANIPILTMNLLVKMKCREAIPALIDFINRFQTDSLVVENGKPRNQVVEALKSITGQDFGTDQSKWKQWYTAQPVSGK